MKSGDRESGAVIERCEWVEGTEIGYQRSDIGVGTGSNRYRIYMNGFYTYTKDGLCVY